MQGIVLAFWSAVLAALWKISRRTRDAAPAALVVLVAALACAERFLPRPELATYAAFAWFLHIFAAGEAHRPVGLTRLAVIQALWSNAHGLFVLGPFVALAHLVAALFNGSDRREALRSGLPPLAVTLLATLANPSGLHAWQYALVLAREAGQGSSELIGSLGEMTSPFAAAAQSSPAIWVFYALLACGAGIAAGKLVHREIDAGLLIAITCAGLSLSGRRNVVLYALAFVPLAAARGGKLRWAAALARPGVRWLAAVAVAALVAFPLSGVYYLWMQIPARFGPGISPSFFPHALAPQLASGALGSGLMASNTLGGFVSLHGAPRTLPLTDGRWEIYDPKELQQILAATRRPGGWRDVVRERHLGGLLLAHSSPEAAAILPEVALDPGWQLAHLDAAASLWLPASPPGSAAGLPIAGLPSMPRFEDAVLSANYAALIGSRELEIAALERALASNWREVWVRERLAAAQLATGRYTAAAVNLQKLLARAPANPVALNELAFLARRTGDLELAESLLLRLLASSPQHTEARENLARIRVERARSQQEGDTSPPP